VGVDLIVHAQALYQIVYNTTYHSLLRKRHNQTLLKVTNGHTGVFL